MPLFARPCSFAPAHFPMPRCSCPCALAHSPCQFLSPICPIYRCPFPSAHPPLLTCSYPFGRCPFALAICLAHLPLHISFCPLALAHLPAPICPCSSVLAHLPLPICPFPFAIATLSSSACLWPCAFAICRYPYASIDLPLPIYPCLFALAHLRPFALAHSFLPICPCSLVRASVSRHICPCIFSRVYSPMPMCNCPPDFSMRRCPFAFVHLPFPISFFFIYACHVLSPNFLAPVSLPMCPCPCALAYFRPPFRLSPSATDRFFIRPLPISPYQFAINQQPLPVCHFCHCSCAIAYLPLSICHCPFAIAYLPLLGKGEWAGANGQRRIGEGT